MDEVINKLMKLCQKRHKSEEDMSGFLNFVEELPYEEIETIIAARIAFTDGPQIINTFLLGLTKKNSSQKKRVKIFEFLIEQIQTVDIPVRNVSTIITWLVVELEKLSTTHLLRVSDKCVNYVSSSSEASHTCWKDLLPKVLSLISLKKEIEHCGSEKSGEEYKKQVIISLCQMKWDTGILTSLASMFIHISMNIEEHSQVVSKLCDRFSDLKPSELPPLVHQLLLLTKHQNTMTLFFSLKNYYNKHIYRLEESLNMVDSTEIECADVIESSTKKDILENQSVVLYHIEDCAKRSLGCTTELLRSAKSSNNAPEVFFEPFLLSVLISLSNIPMYETQVMDILKSMIIRSLLEEEKKVESEWLRSILPLTCDVEQVLIKLIKSSVCDQESVIRGLVNLSMVLIRYSGGLAANKEVCHKVWRLGRMIAVNTVKKHHQVARTVLSSITDAIINRPDVPQYTDCLAEICDTSPLLVVESSGVVARLLEALPELPIRTSHKVISAIISLTRVSSKLRDNLILVLRKSLFMHDESSRKMAVFGFLQLIKRLKLKGLSSLSQNSFQIYTCPSVLTQTCLDVHSTNISTTVSSASNEGICLEVINILKRCFMQQSGVKISLYQGINRALLQNPELCIPVNGVFMKHFAEFYENDPDCMPPLDFTKAVVIRNNDIIVMEPLGYLLYALLQIIVTSKNLPYQDDDEFFGNQEKLQDIFKSLISRFGSCEPKHLELDQDDMDPFKEEILKEVLLIYQSLLVYLISIWDVTVPVEHPREFLTVYRAYNTFVEFSKTLKTKKDGEGGRRGRAATCPTASQANKKVSSFIFPQTIFDFEAIYRLVSLFLCDGVDWSLDEVSVELKNKKAIHRFAMQICLDVLSKAKSQLQDYRAKSVFQHLSKLANLLFEKCLKNFKNQMDNDPQSAVAGVECFTEICSLVITHFKKQLLDFLKIVCGNDLDLNSSLETVIKVYLKYLGKTFDVEEDAPDDPHYKKLITVFITGVNLLSSALPVQEPCITKVVKWLMEVAQQKKISNVANTKTLITLLLNLLLRCKKDSNLQDNIALHLCELFGSINDIEVEKSAITLSIITDECKGAIVPVLCSSLNSRLDSIEWVIVRLKAEVALMSSPKALPNLSPITRKCELKKREKDLVQEVGLIVSCCQWVCAAAVSANLAEQICKLLQHTYSCLTQLTKYFSIRASSHNPVYQEARFGKLVRLSASHLSSQLADFILYIEAVDENERKLSKKVLNQAKKQTIYIPKLVAELENFTKCVTQLSNKCKDSNLSTNMKLTTTRDFRLNTKKLEEVLKRDRESDDDDEPESTAAENGTSQEHQLNTSVKTQPTQKSQKRLTQPIKKRRKLKSK